MANPIYRVIDIKVANLVSQISNSASVYNTTNSGFTIANAGFTAANSGFTVANAGFTAANNALSRNNNKPILSKTETTRGTTPYTITLNDVGGVVASNNSVIYIPNSVFSAGNTMFIYNNTNPTPSSVTLTPNTNVTLRYGGLASGNRTLGANACVQLICLQGIESSSNVFVIFGSGIT